jgi:hypothetical protein
LTVDGPFRIGAGIRQLRMRQFSSIIMLALASLHALPASAQAPTPQLSPNAPEDRPVSATAVCQWQAMAKAMEPYVAQARQSYPDARRRFAGRAQPVRPFFVTTQLHDANGRHEQVFVAVDSIVGARIFGTLSSPINVVQGYRYRQHYDFDEGELLDWTFANADGSEEGNVVGKFIETYTPPRECRDA